MNDFPASAPRSIFVGGNIRERSDGDWVDGGLNEFVEPIGKIVGGGIGFVVTRPVLNGDLREGRGLYAAPPFIGRSPPNFDLCVVLRFPEAGVFRCEFQMKWSRAGLGEC
jgi:hypothetical protein